jgi:3-methyladenine DNA glycosylase AlkD
VPRTDLGALQRQVRALANPDKVAVLRRFFKTGPGQYGEGDRFLGLTLPQLRGLARDVEDLDLPSVAGLLASPWHEERLLGAILLAGRGRRADEAGDKAELERLARFYWRHRAGINNWDLVDASAEHVLGPYYFGRDPAPLFKMARSKRVWDRRKAVLTTFHFIRRGEFRTTLRLAEQLMEDTHDLIHKACGWMLREVGKREPKVLRAFLDANAASMPRTMLRYALEKLAPRERRYYMKKSPDA